MGCTVHGSVASMSKVFARTSRPGLGCTQFPIHVPGGSVSGLATVKNEQSCIYTPSICHHDMDRDFTASSYFSHS